MTSIMREAWIDNTRGLCMLMVLWFHAEMYSGMGQKYSIFVTPFFMQVFFFLSGYLFLRNGNDFSFHALFHRVLRSIWFPYLCFTLAMLLPKMLLHHWGILQGIITILTGRASWFVYVLGLMQLIIGGGYTLFKKSEWSLWGMGLCGFILGWIVFVIPCPGWTECLTAVFRMMPFFVLGINYRRWHDARQSNTCMDMTVFFGSLISYFICWYVDQCLLSYPRIGTFYGCKSYWTYMLLGFWGIVMLISCLKYWPNWSFLRYIGRNSLVFYFLNGLAYTVLIRFLSRYSLPKMILVPTMLILATVILSFISYLIRRYLPLLIGDKTAWDKCLAGIGLASVKSIL